jgi:hAT family C-terminal dimerisation region
LTTRLHGRKKLIRLESLGKTRWFSKEKALLKIFGSFDKPSIEVFQFLLEFLNTIKNSRNFEPKVSLEAGFLLESWTKIETILTAFTFLKIFTIIGPTSKYFQTRGLDLSAVWQMLQSSISKIEKVRNLFESIKNKAVIFAKEFNKAVLLSREVNEDDVFAEEVNEVFVEEELPTKRTRKVKRLPGEKAADQRIEDVWENYRINNFLVICDNISQGLKNRYKDHRNEEVIQEIAFFHPRKFEDLDQEVFNLPYLSRVLKIDESTLIQELKDFADTFITLVKPDQLSNIERSSCESADECESDDECDLEDEEEHKCEHTSKSAKKQCNNCVKCCFKFLLEFNFHVSAFTNVFRVYEYFLTLPCSQIECERVFSKLKIVKSRLRSSVEEDLLDALILMNVERELTFNLDTDKIIYLFASSTPELSRLLIE